MRKYVENGIDPRKAKIALSTPVQNAAQIATIAPNAFFGVISGSSFVELALVYRSSSFCFESSTSLKSRSISILFSSFNFSSSKKEQVL